MKARIEGRRRKQGDELETLHSPGKRRWGWCQRLSVVVMEETFELGTQPEEDSAGCTDGLDMGCVRERGVLRIFPSLA